MIRNLLVLFLALIIVHPAFAALKGGIDYKIPVYYTNLDEDELNTKAEYYYDLVLKLPSKKPDDNMTAALNVNTVLENKCPTNTIYPVRLGSLYDILGKDRYAKGCFSRAIGIDSSRPEPYFYFGEFYYKRQQYRKALKYYLEAYNHGYFDHAQTLSRLSDIYTKLGDMDNALKYCAQSNVPEE